MRAHGIANLPPAPLRQATMVFSALVPVRQTVRSFRLFPCVHVFSKISRKSFRERWTILSIARKHTKGNAENWLLGNDIEAKEANFVVLGES